MIMIHDYEYHFFIMLVIKLKKLPLLKNNSDQLLYYWRWDMSHYYKSILFKQSIKILKYKYDYTDNCEECFRKVNTCEA